LFIGYIVAIYHLHARIIQRSKGRSAVAAAAYRAGAQMLDERTGLTHDYSRRTDVVHSEMMLPYCEEVPEWARNSETLWNHIESIESQTTRPKEAQLAREIEFALPVELNRQEHIKLARDFISRTFVENGMVADFSLHDKEDGNPHVHVMLSMREMKKDGDFHHKKQRKWNAKPLLKKWRKSWEEEANQALEKSGHEARIDHRSLKEQGEERTPSIHMGVTASSMEKKGKPTERGNRQRQIQQDNIIQLEEVRRLKAERAEIEKQIDAEHKKNPALWLEETHGKVMANQRLEREAADLGRQSWDWKKKASSKQWQLDKAEAEQKEHSKKFGEGLESIFKDVEAVKALIGASEWQNDEQAIKDLQKHLKGVSKWFKSKKYVEADKKKIAAVLKAHQRLKVKHARIITLQKEASHAEGQALNTERLFKSQRAALGSSRQRSNRRATLYGKRSEALRYASEKDIWQSNLAIEDKEELAREWEKNQQRSQVQAATYGRSTPSWKDRGGKVDFSQEMKWQENAPKEEAVKPAEKGAAMSKKEEIVESLDEEKESPWLKVRGLGEQVQKPTFSEKVKDTAEVAGAVVKGVLQGGHKEFKEKDEVEEVLSKEDEAWLAKMDAKYDKKPPSIEQEQKERSAKMNEWAAEKPSPEEKPKLSRAERLKQKGRQAMEERGQQQEDEDEDER